MVLWSLRTTSSQATGETPFSLVFGAETVLPRSSSMGNLGCVHITRSHSKLRGLMMSTFSRRFVAGQLCGPLAISKHFAAITAGTSVPGSSK